MKMSWRTITTLVLVLIPLASCASTGNLPNGATNPSTVPWDNLEDPHMRADPAELFEWYWDKGQTNHGERLLVLVEGQAIVACNSEPYAILAATAECRRSLKCYESGDIDFASFYPTYETFWPADEDPEGRMCIQCVCSNHHHK